MAQPPQPRVSQVAVQNAGSTGFLSSVGIKVDGYDALAERLGTPGLKGAPAVHTLPRCVRARVHNARALTVAGVGCTSVVEAYSESWGPCGSVGTLLKKFMNEVNPPEGALEVLVVRALVLEGGERPPLVTHPPC